jgi:membrane-associated protease RseP (regulator of RpoE activity)
MPDYFKNIEDYAEIKIQPKIKKDRYWLHILLFVITFITTTISGMEWTTGNYGTYEFSELAKGLPYSISILLMLTFHEFGHYFAAKYHKIDTTLPYYIPFPPIPIFLNFGTMGAVIKTRSVIKNNKAMFDIGIAGPLAGFVVCVGLLIYGFSNLPGVEYLTNIHPDYFSPEYGKGAFSLEFGDTILFAFLRSIITDPGQFVPPMTEIYHYPFLCVGWFGLFITSMNLIPVGQLDGGHIIYSMFGGKKHEAIASIMMIILIILGFVGLADNLLEYNLGIGWSGWLFWGLILYFIIKVKHPPVPTFYRLKGGRLFLGYLSLFIFIISFSPVPFLISV